MAEITILEEMLLDGFAEQEPGLMGFDTNVEIGLVTGETYRVTWDDDEYSCTAVEVEAGPIAIGNLALGGLDGGNNEPFMMFTMQLDENVYMFAIVTEQEGSSHKVGIYQTAEAEAVPSATIKIKGYSGAEFEYQNVPKVWLAAPESTVDNPVLVPFTYGEAVDNVQIVPDFSSGDHTLKMPAGEMARSAVVKKPDSLIPGNIKAGETVAGITGEYEGEVPETEELTVPADFTAGDMVLVPAEGKYLEQATVTKPEKLIPENIAEGVNIAGIIGTLASGNNVKIAVGSFTGKNDTTTVNHGMGVVPDIVGFGSTSSLGSNPTYTYCVHAVGFSKEFKSVLVSMGFTTLSGMFSGFHLTSGTKNTGMYAQTIDETGVGAINSANETSFNVRPTYGFTHYWFAIAGLT